MRVFRLFVTQNMDFRPPPQVQKPRFSKFTGYCSIFARMNWSLLFVIFIMILLLRVVYLRLKANSVKAESFRNLSDRDKMAVLKECLLNTPTRTNLENLAEFAKTHGFDVDTAPYLKFIERHMRNAWGKNAIAEDNEIYAAESAWIDAIRPLEFAEAEKARTEGDMDAFVERSLEGVSRLYSDDAITAELEKLVPHHPKAKSLIEGYRDLIAARDASEADDKSLEALRKKRDAWMSELLTK